MKSNQNSNTKRAGVAVDAIVRLFWLVDQRPRKVHLSSFSYGLLSGFALGGIPAFLIYGGIWIPAFGIVAAIAAKWAHAQIPLSNNPDQTRLP